ncbi:MAG: hypothetical protein Q7T11_04730 [Deltaproteobacteria bacterium]|nr:hypothetical protein [Deltaproteobacteria bacterium]
MKPMIKMSQSLLGLATLVLLSACGGSPGTTIAGNPTPSTQVKQITIGQLSGDEAVLEIPLSVFGDGEEDLQGSAVTFLLNGEFREYLSSSELSALLEAGEDSVSAVLDGLADGDEIVIAVTLPSGEIVRYEGTVSASGSTEAAQADDGSAGDSATTAATTGTYKWVVTNTCYDDTSDADNLWLVVDDGDVLWFELDDDRMEQSPVLSGDRISYELYNNSAPTVLQANCYLDFSGDAATGECTNDLGTCELRYEKCSDEADDDDASDCR